MPISHAHRTIFVHIPKTAGTSVEAVLGMHGDKEDIGIKPYFNQQVDREHLYGHDLQHMTAADLKQVLQKDGIFDSYFKFSIVRNPWDRLVSAFAWNNLKWANAQELTDTEFEASVRELHALFLTARAARQAPRVGAHLWPQVHYLVDRDRKPLLNYIARHENLAADWQRIREKIGIKADLPSRMRSHHRPYQSYYSDATRDMVAEIYAEDIAALRYSF